MATSCEACRRHHYKCDNKFPRCGRCSRADRSCVRPGRERFRNSDWSSKVAPRALSSTAPQPDIVFIDARDDSQVLHDRQYDGLQAVGPEMSDCHPPRPGETHLISAAVAGPASLPHGRDAAHPWPVGNEQEALLMRHFVSIVSHFFDFSDPRRHFARMAPQRARSNASLANAIFSLSARHLSRTGLLDARVADVYYQRCLQQLIPSLDTDAKDESLLVAAVILRLMEEIDVPITGADRQSHLFGTQAIVKAQEGVPVSDITAHGMLQAAYWAALRQDLYIAFAMKRPISLINNTDHLESMIRACTCAAAALPDGSDDKDAAWTNLAVLQCCKIVQFCFATDDFDHTEYENMRNATLSWYFGKPPTFEPFYSEPSSGDPSIPDIRFLMDWHVAGTLYNLLGRVLLETSRPPGLNTVEAAAAMGASAMRDVLGIGGNNRDMACAQLIGSMAIATGGHLLTDEVEIAAMKRMLIQTEVRHGWPTQQAQQSLDNRLAGKLTS